MRKPLEGENHPKGMLPGTDLTVYAALWLHGHKNEGKDCKEMVLSGDGKALGEYQSLIPVLLR